MKAPVCFQRFDISGDGIDGKYRDETMYRRDYLNFIRNLKSRSMAVVHSENTAYLHTRVNTIIVPRSIVVAADTERRLSKVLSIAENYGLYYSASQKMTITTEVVEIADDRDVRSYLEAVGVVLGLKKPTCKQ